MKFKNILYIGGFKLPDKNAAAHRVLSNAKVLRDLGANVFLVGQSDQLDISTNIVEEESIENNIFMYSKPYPTNMLSWLKYIVGTDYIKNFINKFEVDCVILYNYPSYATYFLLPYLNKNKIKIYADVTEWYGKSDGNIVKRVVKDFDTSFRMKTINPKLDGLICISKYLKEFYKNNNTILVPPLVDLNESKWNDIKGLNKDVGDPITFIYAGQLGGYKDKISRVIELLVELKSKHAVNFIFKVIGVTKEEYLKLYAVDSVDSSIVFYGRKSHVDTLKEVKTSDFVLFFREQNRVNMAGFPTKFVEAKSCGIPVITNSTSDLQDYIINDVNGFLLEDMDENISETFLKILKFSEAKLKELKQNNLINNPFEYNLFFNDFIKLMK